MASLPKGPKGSVAESFTGGMETNNYKQGRSGSKVEMKGGPAKGNSGTPNPTKGGGINRATQGKNSGS